MIGSCCWLTQSWVLIFLQFLGILTAVVLLQVAAGVVGYLFTDLVTSHRHGCHGELMSTRAGDDVTTLSFR